MKFSKYKPLTKKLFSLKIFAGRNNKGRITVRHQGGGHKQLYRLINWKRSFSQGIVTNFEYDPNRSATIAKIFHINEKKESENNSFSYILVPKGLKIFEKIISINSKVKNILFQTGDSSILANLAFGDLIHNVENNPGKGALFARAAGTFCQILI
jgi:large subunit ribosomal protein L2